MTTLNIEIWTPTHLRLAADFLNKMADDTEKTNTAHNNAMLALQTVEPISQVLKDGPHAGRHAIDVVAEQEAAIEAAAPRRGRPRKQQNAQPAVAENTGSTAPVNPPTGEQASTSVAEQSPVVATSSVSATPSISGGVAPNYTAEQVRAKLQEFLATPGGDRGLQLAGDVLAQFGLAKVKQVNDNPQHFAGIVAAVDAELAKLAVAK